MSSKTRTKYWWFMLVIFASDGFAIVWFIVNYNKFYNVDNKEDVFVPTYFFLNLWACMYMAIFWSKAVFTQKFYSKYEWLKYF